ncbi:sensor histidine kinase [Pseudoxanthomonas mexicana]
MDGQAEGASGAGCIPRAADASCTQAPLRPSMLAARPSSPLDALWQTSVVVWVLLAGEGLAAILALAPSGDGNRWIHFGVGSLAIQWILLTTLGSLYVLRRPISAWRPASVAYVALILLVLSTWLVFGLSTWLLADLWPMDRVERLRWLGRLTALALTVGALGLAAFQNHWRTRQLAVRVAQSELEALQARIRPHFLFNTLNTGAALVHQRPEEAERLLLDLSDLFRAALAGPREISLADELSLVRRYLEIEGLRFGDRLRVTWSLPEALPAIAVPALSVQPLVENAIRHGVEPAASGGDVSVEVVEADGVVQITVGNALPATPVRPTAGHQVGLSSVRARVQAMTQGRGSVETQAKDGRYTAILRLPMP